MKLILVGLALNVAVASSSLLINGSLDTLMLQKLAIANVALLGIWTLATQAQKQQVKAKTPNRRERRSGLSEREMKKYVK